MTMNLYAGQCVMVFGCAVRLLSGFWECACACVVAGVSAAVEARTRPMYLSIHRRVDAFVIETNSL
jgi:hypothetical protein